MIRPCFLVVEREYPGSISSRKLVIETAKLNVITAYSGAEAIETLELFPAVHGVVLDAGVIDVPCEALVRALKMLKPSIPVVVVGAPVSGWCSGADHYIDFFDPALLLGLLRKLEPERSAAIETREEDLSKGGL
jgi:hypothetical protein